MRHRKGQRAFIASLIVLISTVSCLLAATINVPSGTYPTIQAGVNAAATGDTVSVAAGTYPENVVVGKDGVIIEGAGAGRTFLNLTTIGGTAFTFENVTGSTLRGFTVRKADIGVKARKSKPDVTNNIFLDNINAFENRSSYSRVINNTFYSNTRAVFTNYSSTLTNNIFARSERYAVIGSKAGSIRYNLFYRNTIGNYSGISEPPATFKNITGNPLFVNFTSDFHLRTGSPAIKKGDPSLKNSFNNMTSDIGVYGGPKADVKPATVTGVAAASSQTQVTVSWDMNLAYNISDHRVYYGKTFGNHTSTFVSAGNANEWVFTNLSTNRKYYFSVRAVDTNDNKSDFSTAVTGAIDTIPPSQPTNLRADVGDRRLYLSWGAATDNESGVRGYKVYYGTSSGSYSTPIDVGNTTSYELTSLTNGVTYYTAVSAYDYAGNEGPYSAEVSETPEEIRGIEGLKDTGGCFIATAAYGSYEAPYVKVLREFRDNYLIANFKMQNANCKIEVPNILGRAFVRLYYKFSPPVADFIMESEALKALVRAALLPVIGVAWMLINHPLLVCTGSLFILLALTGLKTCFYENYSGLIRRNMASAMLKIIILSFFILLFNSSISLGGERTGLSFGLTYGQLEPASDEWKEIYGDKRISNYRASLGYRFHPTFGAEAGVGYLIKEGKGRTVTGRESGAEVTFLEAPVDLTILYRFNYLPEQVIIPYIGGGVSYNLYWENVEDGKEIEGGMWGHHAGGGMQLFLDRFDERSARSLRKEYGIMG